MDETIKIDLFGREFRFKPDSKVHNPEKIAQHLRKYISEAEELIPDKTAGKTQIAVLLLAAMNLAKDFHELEIQHAELERLVDNRTSSIIERLNKGKDIF